MFPFKLGSIIFFLTTALFLTRFVSGELTCRDESGNPVDWFVIYKLPHMKRHPNALIRKGIGYFYMDANRPAFDLSDRNLTLKDHAIAHTLAGVYDNYNNKDDIGYVLYNDQVPGGGWSEKFGHTKGALALDAESGWWLVHSLPHFPPKAEDGYSLPSNALYFGQTFLCLSLSSSQFSTVGDHLLFTYPWTYDFRIPEWVADEFPSLDQTTKEEHVVKPPLAHLGEIQTLAGVQFKTFGKSGKWGQDLYHDLVAPSLGLPLNVETWRRDKKVVLPSNCSRPFPVYNVDFIDFRTQPYYTRFSYMADHSKWALSRPSGDLVGNTLHVSADWICIGGINRESTQFRRGGGTVCTMKPSIWEQFNRIVTSTEPCP